MKNCLKTLCYSMFFFLTVVGLANADVLEKVKTEGVLVVGTSADYPPYEFKDVSDNFTGFDIDLVNEVANRMGVKARIVDMGFDTLIAALQNDKVDAVVAAMQGTAERDKKVDFSKVYHEIKDAFLVKAGSGIALNSPYDAANLRIAVQTGTIQEKWAQKNLVDAGKTPQKNLFSYERVDQAAMDIAAGRVDVLFIISDPAKPLAEKAGLEIALITTETVSAGQVIAVPEGEVALKAEIDQAIESMIQDGTMTQLMDKYGLF